MNNQPIFDQTLPTLALNTFGRKVPAAKQDDDSELADEILPALMGGQICQLLGQVNQVMGEAAHFAESYLESRNDTPTRSSVPQTSAINMDPLAWIDPVRAMQPDAGPEAPGLR